MRKFLFAAAVIAAEIDHQGRRYRAPALGVQPPELVILFQGRCVLHISWDRSPDRRIPLWARIRRSAPCGLWRGGGPGPCGRWRWTFSCGSRAPWSADASWAGKYAACRDTSFLFFERSTLIVAYSICLSEPYIHGGWSLNGSLLFILSPFAARFYPLFSIF